MFELIKDDLIDFQKPARYIGDELGIPDKSFQTLPVRFAICYPDIYEIGMSNLGIKIIYDRINRLAFAGCERVFSPWIDFEAYLRKNKYQLYSLETKTPLSQFDFLGFSLQYELLFTNVFTVIELGGIEPRREKRTEQEPIIIGGGPVTLNPAPFAPFFDLFIIGEGENVIRQVMQIYHQFKQAGQSKKHILKELAQIEGVYAPGYPGKKIEKQVYPDFNRDQGLKNYIIPNIDIIQNKLVIEIMRGCPNKCRFCEAGVLYKPYREKSIALILQNIARGLSALGTNEVTLSSLSSGDYSGIIELIDQVNQLYQKDKVSFSLPSIRVESFNLDLLQKLSLVRKSGLTFAIEAGSEEGQRAINKIVSADKINHIINQAALQGWRLIKLYFMLGLPYIDNEIEQIIAFVDPILKMNKKIKINLNIGTFVPKPHTPFQSVQQMPLSAALEKLSLLEDYYRKTRVKIKKHDPHMSYIEGFIARGDEKIGLAIYQAYQKGARFDGWDGEFQYSIYEAIFKQMNIQYSDYLAHKDPRAENSWHMIDIGFKDGYLTHQLQKAAAGEMTADCRSHCEEECGLCHCGGHKNDAPQKKAEETLFQSFAATAPPNTPLNRVQYFLEFSKTGLLKYMGHIDLIRYFERLFRRAKVALYFTQGFNPHPKFQFSPALPLGIESKCEILEFYTTQEYESPDLLRILKKYQHPRIQLNRIKKMDPKIKLSLINSIFLTDYILNFKNKYYNDIINKVESFNRSGLNYDHQTKKRVIKGHYQDCVQLSVLSATEILMQVKKKDSFPKITGAVNDLFPRIPVHIIKNKIYTMKNNQLIELFDFEGSYED